MSHYILFDTETTGTNETDRIIQVGAMVLHNDHAPEVYNELCQSEVPISLEAMEIHGITNEMLIDKPSFEALTFTSMIQKYNSSSNYLIAHNINFDLGMLQKEGFENQYITIDTLRCAKHLLPDLPNHRLQYLRYALELYKTEEEEAKNLNMTITAHDALSDVLILKLLVSKLVAIVKEQSLSNTPMHYLTELTTQPVLLKTFQFGKYKGRTIQEVVKEDRGYLEWMLNNMELDEDLKFTLEHHLYG
jgi:DNA polymerase III epsilon subunit-like protein